MDPHFNEIVAKYLQFLDQTGIPSSSGWLLFEDEPMKQWEQKGMQGWIRDYEKKVTKDRIQKVNLLRQDGFPKKGVTGLLKGPAKDLSQNLSLLSKESQDYYLKAFAPFSSEKSAIEFLSTKTKEEGQRAVTDYLTDVACLEMHVGSFVFENQAKSSPEEYTKQYTRMPVLLSVLMSAYESVCVLVHGKELRELLKDGKREDENAFFALLQIDRTVIECDWAQKMIRKAQLTADKRFFKRMAKAISTDPLENAKIYGRASIVILLFWKLCLYRLNHRQLIDFLNACGMNVQDSDDAFRKFVSRLIPPDKKKNILPFYSTGIE